MASLTRNTLANYLGQGYSIVIGLLVLPLFLQYMGGEAYGLIAVFTLMQSWMQLLDLGISPTLGREVARMKEIPDEHARLITIVNSLEFLFVLFSIIIACTIISASDYIAAHWLKVHSIPIETVTQILLITGVVIAIRWSASIHKSAINAYEAQVWMNGFDVIINTLRFPLLLLVVVYNKNEILLYFWCQFLVSIIELLGVKWKSASLLPRGVIGERFSFIEVKRLLPFAFSIGYTSAIWVFLTQYDKLLLSNVLPLDKYGYFSLIGTVTAGVMMLSAPISKAILPRMTALISAQKTGDMVTLYRKATQYVVLSATPIVMVIVFWPYEVIYAWSGNHQAASWIAESLPIFAIGSLLVTIMTFQYYLQYSYGILKYHVIYNTVAVLINVPLITYVAYRYSVTGVAWVWLGFRIFSFLFWVPFVHKIFLPKLHRIWLWKDVAIPAFLSIAITLGLNLLTESWGLMRGNRLHLLMELIAVMLVSYILEFLIWKSTKIFKSIVCG